MKKKLKSALKSLAQLMSRIWGFMKENSVPLMTVDSFVAVAVLGNKSGIEGSILMVIWAIIYGILLAAMGSGKKSERERFGRIQEVRRFTKRTPHGVVVSKEDLSQALAVLADLEDYMGK